MDEMTKRGLGIALNEATWLGAEVDRARRMAALTFRVLTLPAEGREPSDTRLSLVLSPVGRIAASLRHGRGDDADARVEHFTLDALLGVVQSFGGLPIYGWEFFDQSSFARWSAQLSLDEHLSGDGGNSHSIDLFQDGGGRQLDVRVWFDGLRILDPLGAELSVDEVIAGGSRWWDALNAGDPRTEGHALFPLKRSKP